MLHPLNRVVHWDLASYGAVDGCQGRFVHSKDSARIYVYRRFLGTFLLLLLLDGSYQHILESIMCRVDNISVLKQTSSLQSHFWVETDFSILLGPEGGK